MKKVIGLMFFILLGRLYAQDTFSFGATTNVSGGTLVFENVADYVASNLFCFGTSPGTALDSSAGGYYTAAQIFSALPATDPNAAAPGTVIQVKLLSVEGPAGASVGFLEIGAVPWRQGDFARERLGRQPDIFIGKLTIQPNVLVAQFGGWHGYSPLGS